MPRFVLDMNCAEPLFANAAVASGGSVTGLTRRRQCLADPFVVLGFCLSFLLQHGPLLLTGILCPCQKQGVTKNARRSRVLVPLDCMTGRLLDPSKLWLLNDLGPSKPIVWQVHLPLFATTDESATRRIDAPTVALLEPHGIAPESRGTPVVMRAQGHCSDRFRFADHPGAGSVREPTFASTLRVSIYSGCHWPNGLQR
jgi:hypothetical protein